MSDPSDCDNLPVDVGGRDIADEVEQVFSGDFTKDYRDACKSVADSIKVFLEAGMTPEVSADLAYLMFQLMY